MHSQKQKYVGVYYTYTYIEGVAAVKLKKHFFNPLYMHTLSIGLTVVQEELPRMSMMTVKPSSRTSSLKHKTY